MSIPQDPTAGIAPEDVEAHMPFRRGVVEEQDQPEDVEAHRRYIRITGQTSDDTEDVEGHVLHRRA